MACNKDLQAAGTAYPRTCHECGLGPCTKYPPFASLAHEAPNLAQPAQIWGYSVTGFETALAAMKVGRRVARKGWNGKGMWLQIKLVCVVGLQTHGPDADIGKYQEHAQKLPVMKTATGEFVPWLCSLTDMVAEDWEVLP